MDVITVVSGYLSVIKSLGVKILAVIQYMFDGSCGKVARALSFALEPISKSTVHEPSEEASSQFSVALEPNVRRCIAVEETKG